MKIVSLECENFTLYVNDTEKPFQAITLNGTTALLCSNEPVAIVGNEKLRITTFFADRKGVELIGHKEAFFKYCQHLGINKNLQPVTEKVMQDTEINVTIPIDEYLDWLDFKIDRTENEINCVCNDVSSYLVAEDYQEAAQLVSTIKALREYLKSLCESREAVKIAKEQSK